MKALKWTIIAMGFLTSGALAQQVGSNAAPPIFVPTTLPLPPEGCVWAGRAYSEGAQFCVGTRMGLKCMASRWEPLTATEACASAGAIDTK